MPLSRPTINTIAKRLISDLETRLTGNTALLPVALLRIICIVFAVGMHILYGILRLLSINILPDTKNLEWLKRHGKEWGVVYHEATYAGGGVIFTGDNDVLIPKNTRLQEESSGSEYETLTNGTISGGSVTVSIKAVIEGKSSNYLKESPEDTLYLNFVSPISGVDETAEVVNEVDGGNDAETVDAYSLRIQQRIQRPGAGGSEPDYERWALEVDGVDGAWIKPSYFGAGTCIVVIQPSSESLAEDVQNYINIRQPVTANQPLILTGQDYVYPIDEVIMEYTLKIDPNTDDIKALITEAVEDFHNDEGEPGGTLLMSHLRSAIASTGVYNYEITVIEKGGVPQSIDDIVFTGFEFPTLEGGGITYIGF